MFDLPGLPQLALRLARLRDPIEIYMTQEMGLLPKPGAPKGCWTLLHGSLKPSHVFFKQNEKARLRGTPPYYDAIPIDFSYTGIGLAAADVCFLLSTSIAPSMLGMGCAGGSVGEIKLLRFYFQCLTKTFQKNRHPARSTFTWGRFLGQYKVWIPVLVFAWPPLHAY